MIALFGGVALSALVTDRRDLNRVEEHAAIRLLLLKHATVMVVVLSQRADAKQDGAAHTQQWKHDLFDHLWIAICSFFKDYDLTTNALQRLCKTRRCPCVLDQQQLVCTVDMHV